MFMAEERGVELSPAKMKAKQSREGEDKRQV